MSILTGGRYDRLSFDKALSARARLTGDAADHEAAFLSAGVRGLNLGPYVLRLETAAVCGLAVLRQMMAGEEKR